MTSPILLGKLKSILNYVSINIKSKAITWHRMDLDWLELHHLDLMSCDCHTPVIGQLVALICVYGREMILNAAQKWATYCLKERSSMAGM